MIPPEWVPDWLLIEPLLPVEVVLNQLQVSAFSWPVIAKPDQGERGTGVQVLQYPADFIAYHNAAHSPYLIQKYCTLPIELGAFYIRHPARQKGNVTSVVRKSFLTMTGDGRTSVGEWCNAHPRAWLVLDYLHKKWSDEWHTVPSAGEVRILEPVGNHCRGTAFLDYTDHYAPILEPVIHSIASQIPGFFYGRFDLRCEDPMHTTLTPNTMAILELNGCSAEPAHMYQSGYSFWRAQRVLLWHTRQLFEIARYNHASGVPYLSTATFITNWRAHRRKQTQWKQK